LYGESGYTKPSQATISCTSPTEQASQCAIGTYANELIDFFDIFELGVAVQQQRRVIGRCLVLFVQCLQIGGQVLDLLAVEELLDHVRWLETTDGFQVLTHCRIVFLGAKSHCQHMSTFAIAHNLSLSLSLFSATVWNSYA
jgi:hypothetical protein